MAISSKPSKLQDLHLNESYRSHDPQTSVVNDFYIPALSAAKSYDRAVGYFSSGSLTLFAEGLEAFRQANGKIRLVASPQLSESDYDEILRGYELREVMERRALSDLEEWKPEDAQTLTVLGDLIMRGELDIKLATITDVKRVGIYHEKIGIITDVFGNSIAFTGSSNETSGGLERNYESIEVFFDWSTDRRRVERIKTNFDNLWNNDSPGLSVVTAPLVEARLIQIRQDFINDSGEAGESQEPAEQSLRPPEHFRPRDYQKDAVNRWVRNRFRGILAMATGTGKTKTALLAASHLRNILVERRNKSLIVVIVVPYKNLVDQWESDVLDFGSVPIKIYGDSASWRAKALIAMNSMISGSRKDAIFICTNKSFGLGPFQDLLSGIGSELLLIADEAHHLGANWARNKLPINADFRLALSATPVRHNDDTGTAFLNDYFDRIIYEFPMDEAIEKGHLCKYEYHPRIAELNEGEMIRYKIISTKISALFARGASLDDPDAPLGRLLRQRSQILDHAESKLPLFLQDIKNNSSESHQLIYCAEGRSDDTDREAPKQINRVTQIIGKDLGISVHSYHHETPDLKRKEILDMFDEGDRLQAITSMKCLDEGVDIPRARIGYLLASSANPRQFVQRRGRLLRNAPGKKRAIIYDYLAIPKRSENEEVSGVERRMVERELTRANEFAKLSVNFGESLDCLREVKEYYNLNSL